MQSIHTLLHKLSLTNSRNKKKKIINSMSMYNDGGTCEEVVKHALSPYVNYDVSISKFPRPNPQYDKRFCEDWPRLKLFLHQLSRASRKGISTTFSCIGGPLDKWMGLDHVSPILSRILSGDLRCGASLRTFNSVFDSLIPEFQVSCPNHSLSNIKFPVWAEPKHCGVRSVAIFDDDGNLSLIGKRASMLRGYPNISRSLKSLKLKNVVIDGIIRSATLDIENHDEYRKRGSDDIGLVFVAFDCIECDEFMRQRYTKTLSCRRDMLLDLILGTYHPRSDFIEVATGTIEDDMLSLFNRYHEYLDRGFSGVLAKNPKSKYIDRFNPWIDLSPGFKSRARVCSIDTNKDGGISGITVECKNHKTFINHGISDVALRRLWRERDTMPGKDVYISGYMLDKKDKILQSRFNGFVNKD